jgi:ubiquinone biosynthesis protein
VHRATLKTGEEVVIKVKRPGVEELFRTDIDILLYCAKLLKEKFPQDFMDPIEIVHEFERYTTAELDFKIEARNLEFFHQGFLRFPSVRAPLVFQQHSTERVIVMEYLEGQKLSAFAKSDAKIASRKAVLQHIVASTFHQIFVMGHFHADPHPGNILVLENNVVGYIDFGLLGHLTDSMKERMILLFMSVIEADVDGLVDSLIDIGAAQGDINREAFKQDLIVRLGQFYDLSLRETNIHKLADTILGIARDYRLSIPSNVVMLMKTVVTIESIGEGLYPNFNLISFARPSIKKMIQREFSLSNVRNGFVKKARRLKRTMMVLPEQLYQFLAKLNKGEFKVEFEHKDMSMLVYQMEKTSNKLVFGILTGASIIGAALAMDLPGQMLVLGLPFLSFVGFCMALCFGLLLVYEVVRR